MFKLSILALAVVFSFSACHHNPIYNKNHAKQAQDKKKKKKNKKCKSRECRQSQNRD